MASDRFSPRWLITYREGEKRGEGRRGEEKRREKKRKETRREEQCLQKRMGRKAKSDCTWREEKETKTLKTELKQAIPNKQTHRMTTLQYARVGAQQWPKAIGTWSSRMENKD